MKVNKQHIEIIKQAGYPCHVNSILCNQYTEKHGMGKSCIQCESDEGCSRFTTLGVVFTAYIKGWYTEKEYKIRYVKILDRSTTRDQLMRMIDDIPYSVTIEI